MRIIIIARGNGVKTKDLIKLLESNGWKFKRHGSDHDIYIKATEIRRYFL
jgi:predicted RNA binding protein YcfA (HicA-like mRNA interferase family)